MTTLLLPHLETFLAKMLSEPKVLLDIVGFIKIWFAYCETETIFDAGSVVYN